MGVFVASEPALSSVLVNSDWQLVPSLPKTVLDTKRPFGGLKTAKIGDFDLKFVFSGGEWVWKHVFMEF